MLCYNVIRIIL